MQDASKARRTLQHCDTRLHLTAKTAQLQARAGEQGFLDGSVQDVRDREKTQVQRTIAPQIRRFN